MSCEECVHWPPSAMSGKPCCFCYPDTPMNYLDAYKKFENICFAV